MKVVLRIIAVLAGIMSVLAFHFIVDSNGKALSDFFGSGRLLATMIGIKILLAFILGAIAAIQLWRLRHGGRYVIAAFFAYGAVYELVDLLIPRRYAVDRSLMLGNLVLCLAMCIVVLLPAAARACERKMNNDS